MEVEIGRGKKGRRAYGFDDIAIVPSRRTRDPDDIDITWMLGPYRVRAAPDRVGDGRRRLARDRLDHRQARRPRRAQPGGHLDPLRGRGRRAGAHRGPAQGDRHRRDAAHLLGAGQGGADRGARARDQGGGVVAAASLTPQRVRDYWEIALEAGLDILGDPGHGGVRRARVHALRAAQPEGVHPRDAGAGRGRRLRLVLDRPAPRCARAPRACSSALARARVHHARRARHRRAAGARRSRIVAAARSQHMLETGEYVQGDRRRRHAQRRRCVEGDRLRRRRRDDRLAARRAYEAPGHGYHWGWPPSTRRCRAERA